MALISSGTSFPVKLVRHHSQSLLNLLNSALSFLMLAPMLYTMRPVRLTVGLTWRRRSLINLDLTRNTGSVRFHSIKLDSSPITGSPAALDISFTPEHSSSSHSYSHFLTCQRWNVAGGHGPPGSHSRQMQRCSVKTSCSLQRRIWMNFFF